MQRKKFIKAEFNIQELWGNFKSNIYIIEMLEEEINHRAKEIFEIIRAENFPKLMTYTEELRDYRAE